MGGGGLARPPRKEPGPSAFEGKTLSSSKWPPSSPGPQNRAARKLEGAQDSAHLPGAPPKCAILPHPGEQDPGPESQGPGGVRELAFCLSSSRHEDLDGAPAPPRGIPEQAVGSATPTSGQAQRGVWGNETATPEAKPELSPKF